MGNLAAGLDDRVHALEIELRQLESERDRYAELFARAPCAYVLTDAGGAILEANAAAGELLGRPAGALAGKVFAYFVPLEQRRVFLGNLAALRPGARVAWQGAVRGRHADTRVEFTVRAAQRPRQVLLYWLLRPLERA